MSMTNYPLLTINPFEKFIYAVESIFFHWIILFYSTHGRAPAAAYALDALSRRHADRQPGGHHAARAAGVARMRRRCRRGYAAVGTIIETFRDLQAVAQLFPV